MRRRALWAAACMVMLAACGSSTAEEDRNIAFPIGFFSKQANAITAGLRHSCAITTKGVVECWGANSIGQLGIAQPDDAATPVVVPGLPADRKAVRLSQGSFALHTCVILDNADLWCWGDNRHTQSAATGPATQSIGATRVAINVVDVAVTYGATCLVKKNGALQCWGESFNLRLGWGNRFPRQPALTYETVQGDSLETNGARAVDVEAGAGHFCALFDDQTVDCWGKNDDGQTGQDPTSLKVSSPTMVSGLSNVTDIALGNYHSCAITTGREILCWGSGGVGQLGSNQPNSTHRPVRIEFPPAPLGGVLPPPTLKSIFGGANNTCVVDETDMAKCWGSPNNGLWGSNVVDPPRYVTAVVGTEEFAVGALGGEHLCTVNVYGLPRCLGFNTDGQLGTGVISDERLPSTPVKTYAAANAKVQLPGLTVIGVDFGLVGGGTAAEGLAGQQPVQLAPAPVPTVDPSAQPGETIPPTTLPDESATATTTTTIVAGNTTAAPATSATAKALPRLKVRRTARTSTLARWSSLKVPKGAKVTFTITRGSKRLCARNAGTLQGVRAGVCTVTVKVAKKGTRTTTKKISILIVR